MEPEHQSPDPVEPPGDPGASQPLDGQEPLQADLWGFEAPAPAQIAPAPRSQPATGRFQKLIHSGSKSAPAPEPIPELIPESLLEPEPMVEPSPEPEPLPKSEPPQQDPAEWLAKLDDSFAPLEDFAPLEEPMPVEAPAEPAAQQPLSAVSPMPLAALPAPVNRPSAFDRDFGALEDPWELEGEPLAAAAPADGLLHELNGGWTHWLRCVVRRIGSFSMLEQAAWIGLLLLLGGFAALAFVPALRELPQQRAALDESDFPIAGGQLEVAMATTWWRAPVTEGPDADICRRGTLLLPVVKLDITAKANCAIRVIFRNEDGVAVGDPISRSLAAGSHQLSLAGSAGFDQSGMFAAYRTGEARPWTVEVYESSSVDAGADGVRLLFELPIQPKTL